MPAVQAQAPIPHSEAFKKDKAWLLAQLMIELKFDPQKTQQLSEQLDTMTDEQLAILLQAYKDRVSKRDAFAKQQLEIANQNILNQAQLDKQEAESFRNHLQREYDQRILQGNMEQNLFRQNLVNQQNAQWGWNRYTGGGFGGYYYPNTSFHPPGYGLNFDPWGNYNGLSGAAPPPSYPSWVGGARMW